MFTKSPNLSKIGAITTVKGNEVKNEENESPAQENNVINNEKNAVIKDASSVSETGAVLLLNEIVSKAANNSRLQNDFNSIKL